MVVMLLSVGVSLFLSALNVYYRDFMYALPFCRPGFGRTPRRLSMLLA